MRSVVVIQARTSSSRLPAKVLLPIAGYPLVVLAARRAANTGKEVIVAISDDKTDDYLADVLSDLEIKFFRGSLKNVLSRFVDALIPFDDQTVIVRLTADNVLPDGYLIDEVEKYFIEMQLDYLICNGADSGLPYGLSMELTRLGHLRAALHETTDAFDIEHVTPSIRRKFGSHYFKEYLPLKMGNYRVTVDCLEDYLLIANLFGSVGNPTEARSITLIENLKDLVELPISSKPVKKLVFGAVQLGMSYGVANSTGKPNFAQSKKMLKTAINNGVSAIDTASSYGDSELIIGNSLDRGLKSRVSIITKLDPLGNLPAQAETSVIDSFVDASVYRSLSRLGADQIDTLLLHRASHMTEFNGAIFKRLLSHLDSGLIGSLGVSVQSPAEFIEALDYTAIGHIQMPFNLLDWRWEDAIAQLKRARASRNIVIHLRSVFLQGLLLLRDGRAWKKANYSDPDALFHWLDGAVELYERESIQDLCISFVNGLDWVDGIVIGMETHAQLAENLMLFSKKPLDASQYDELVGSRPHLQEATLNPSLWAKS